MDTVYTSEWLEQVAANKDKLISLLRNWHPTRKIDNAGLPITATRAQAGCDNISASIKAAFKGDPVEAFETALAKGDTRQIIKLLDHAWFGVPESTACWQIEGFSEAVRLLEEAEDFEEGPDEDEL